MDFRRLRAVRGPLRGVDFPLSERTVIGRAGDVQVQLLSRGVSRHHAVITCESTERPVLRDLTSSNGTFLNGDRVSQRPLAHGDRLKIDSHEFVYEETETLAEDDEHLTVLSGPAEEITALRDDITAELAIMRATWRPPGNA